MTAATRATYVHGPKFGGLGVYAVLYLAFVYIPVLFLPLFSFNDSIYIAFPLKGFTLEWYGKSPRVIGSVRVRLTNSARS